ncbi:uncharacterized protein TRIVIDRAFT_65725 [Trichoderma virens Gv29-8]|uniref:C2H2-type domain-containing protein n=1 Tax=Hypocrea virens (strain Gv29-8 / FGSC 10586) TaxID=413071 RepID=G9N991_HYPVG|nr:uncharacterized protein TRIVIDRAFT_65725 [Trichoderma virens Gv29-8]EHK16512.1 hypothetical protein TRIVIDRAFT_65725 [Trichoderma virens Gv29-8]UKZ52110.1 hypothetical protein TrVGV298_005883 [Trichoderma virens]
MTSSRSQLGLDLTDDGELKFNSPSNNPYVDSFSEELGTYVRDTSSLLCNNESEAYYDQEISLSQLSEMCDEFWIGGLSATNVATSTSNGLSVDMRDKGNLDSSSHLEINDIPSFSDDLKDQKHLATPESVVLRSGFEAMYPASGDPAGRALDTIHSSERPFACKHCPETFKRRDALKRHERYLPTQFL